MDLTVCICTHNRPQYVRECLEGLRRQTAPRQAFSLLLVDSASDPNAAAELKALAAQHDARLIRLNRPGVSVARNAGAWAARTRYIAYVDDEAIPSEDWVQAILSAIARPGRTAALIGGRILPKWEVPFPGWWPSSLRGVLSIVEYEGEGEYRSPVMPRHLEPYGANVVVHVLSFLAAGGFAVDSGLYRECHMSDEVVQLAWRLQDAGNSVRYDPRIVVYHQIQARRLDPAWLLSRMYWQGASTVLMRRMLHQRGAVWRELPRRVAVAALLGPAALVPRHATVLIAARWRVAYAAGFIRAALRLRPSRMAAQPAPIQAVA
jgi:glycosyltransferase involved in cell wall biosynthesis